MQQLDILATIHFLEYGPDAWLLSICEQLSDSERVALLHRIHASLGTRTWPELIEWTLGYETLLMEFRNAISKNELLAALEAVLSEPVAISERSKLVEIPTRYDGPDLQDVAAATNLSVEEVIDLHSSTIYTVRFLGFTPGFAYLDGLDKRLHLPRRSMPREKMTAGAVAIGGVHTGVYTIPSPGGWNWLGNTEMMLFQKGANDCSFVLEIGDRVKFVTI